MSVQRTSLTSIKTELLRIVGHETSAYADWDTDARLYEIINRYGQRLPLRASQIARENKIPIGAGIPRFDMYKTRTTVTLTGGETDSNSLPQTTFKFPTDFDHWISFYDETHKNEVVVTTEVTRLHLDRLKKKNPGVPEAIEIGDFYLDSTIWRRRGFIYPPSPSGMSARLELWYYRLPAVMPGTDPDNEYVDADVKYHSLWIYGPACELLRPDDPQYERYSRLEKEMLVDLVASARMI
jgi:hypothetical protein